MKKYAQSKLGELVQITGGGTPSRSIPEYWGGEIPWVTVKDFISKRIVDAQEKITSIGLENSASNLIPAKSILMPTRMALGKIAINDIPVAINQDIKALQIIDTDKVNLQYLVSYLSTISNVFEKAGKGATVKGIKLDFLKDISIPLPPLDDQIRIATVLTRAEKLIAKRKESIKALDELLKSTFLEMFGDPVRNEKGWEKKDLGNISRIQGGLQVTTKRVDNPIELPYLRVANVYRDLLDLREIKTIKVTKEEAERVCLKKGDILVVEGHGNPTEIGRSAVWNGSIQNCLHQNHLIRVRVDTHYASPVYISYYINSSSGRQQMFKAGKTTSGLNTISSKNVKETLVLLPPLTLQNQFVTIVEKVESLKSRYTQSLTELENLYGSLSLRAFKGELDLSGIEIEADATEWEI